jgi:hypothetical protein
LTAATNGPRDAHNLIISIVIGLAAERRMSNDISKIITAADVSHSRTAMQPQTTDRQPLNTVPLAPLRFPPQFIQLDGSFQWGSPAMRHATANLLNFER